MSDDEGGIDDSAAQKIVDTIMVTHHDLSLFATGVRVSEVKKTSTKEKERVLICGKYRVYFVSNKGKLRQALHLIDLMSIKSSRPSEALLQFRQASLLVKSPVIDDVIAYISSAFSNHFFTVKLRVEVTPESRLKPLPSVEPAPCGAFGETYRAICSFYNSVPRDDIYWDISNIYHVNNVRVLDVNEFETLSSHDFKLLLFALNFNSNYFTALKIKNYKLTSDQIQLVGECLPRVSALEKLVLDNTGGATVKDSAIATLNDSISRGRNTSLTSLNLSHFGIDDKGAKKLAMSLLHGGCALRRLRMRNWFAVSGKGMAGFFTELKKSARITACLTSLDLTGNKLTDDACVALGSFLSSTSNLLSLTLANTGANVEAISDALPIGCSRLQRANFSGCRFSNRKDQHHMLSFLASTATLQSLDISNSSITIDTLRLILKAIAGNLALQSLHLSLAQNKLGVLAANLIAHMAAEFVGLESLDLTDTDLGDEGVAYVTEGLCKNRCLRLLKLGKNLRSRTKMRPQAIKNLVTLLESPCPLVALSFEGVPKSDVGQDLGPLLLALGSNDRLISLDISCNGIGNRGMFMLAKSLQVNQSLKRLWIDENNITAAGYQVLAIALERNDSLTYIANPIFDIANALKSDDPSVLVKAWTEVERSLFVNLENQLRQEQSADAAAAAGVTPGAPPVTTVSPPASSAAALTSETDSPRTAAAAAAAAAASNTTLIGAPTTKAETFRRGLMHRELSAREIAKMAAAGRLTTSASNSPQTNPALSPRSTTPDAAPAPAPAPAAAAAAALAGGTSAVYTPKPVTASQALQRDSRSGPGGSGLHTVLPRESLGVDFSAAAQQKAARRRRNPRQSTNVSRQHRPAAPDEQQQQQQQQQQHLAPGQEPGNVTTMRLHLQDHDPSTETH